MPTEVVPFRLIVMPCCEHAFCSVNARWPTYCPACGKFVFDRIKECAVITDERATLKYREGRK